jgi:hypothetical protein
MRLQTKTVLAINAREGRPVMRTILLAAALALSVSAASAGPTVHKEVLGSHCPIGSVARETYYQSQDDQSQDVSCREDRMTIYPTHYEGWEFTCRFIAVKTWFDPNIIASTKTMGVKVSRVEARCEGLDHCTWKEQLTLFASKGTLVLKDGRRFRERGCGL